MNPTQPPAQDQARSRRGQTMAEFALTLPILLLLMFGVIEFARIFHAWVTLQNAARAAARYAVTGRWDEDIVSSVISYSSPLVDELQRRNDILDTLVPCTTGFDEIFYNHWGQDCDPTNVDHTGLREDLARMPSIVDRARIGAASLALAQGEKIEGLKHPFQEGWVNSETVGEDQSGWFHVYICSSRPSLYHSDPLTGERPSRYIPSTDRSDRICGLNEAPDATLNQYDAGGPGDAVEIVVFFNHPLITPLGLMDFIQLEARRVMVNESFRSTRLVNLPPQLGAPTRAPTQTYTPSATFTPSDTPTITQIPTGTQTSTPVDTAVPTQPPDCALMGLTNVQLSGSTLQMTVRNDNPAPVFITRAEIHWPEHTLFPAMALSEMRFNGRGIFWQGPDYDPPTDVQNGSDGWFNGSSPYINRQLEGNRSRTFEAKFNNGPGALSDYFSTGSFNGTRIYFGTEWGGVNQDCVFEITGYPTPEPSTEPPTETPIPVCENYLVQFVGFRNFGVVQYSITNTDRVVAYLTGFSIHWNTYDRDIDKRITLNFVSAGGTDAQDSRGVVVWDGSISSPPATVNEGSAGWRTSPVIEPGRTVDIWVDFDGTNKALDAEGYFRSDFNATSFNITWYCDATPQPALTPLPTNTPGPTNTPKPTKTPRPPEPTNTPRPPRPTDTPGPPEPTDTPRPPEPTDTPKPANTPIIPPDCGGESNC